jgi:eukaryotic-like serine/threonine-protein kinase
MMSLRSIRLPVGEWEYDESKPLGKPGGFGEVFHGIGANGSVAIKRLKVNADQAAHRELNIGQSLMQQSFSNVVPVLDAGQDSESDRYFLVMPVCAFSLQDKINEADGAIDEAIAMAAINGIINGLTEVENIVHRDLKPANVLYHEGTWKIADFGIAKFVEDSTSMETLRNSLTPMYAAPEQWRGERPTAATDIYALGCIVHSLFTGKPPFNGSIDDIRESHLHKVPSSVAVLPPRFSAFVAHMLRKPPNARPTLVRCAKVLLELPASPASSESDHPAIDEAAKQVAERESQEEASDQAAAALRREREQLFADAKSNLLSIKENLFSRIRESSESVKLNHRDELVFGDANLKFTRAPEFLEEFVLSRHAKGGKPYGHTGWDVLGWSMIAVSSASTSYTWSATLLFADLKDGNGFRWYEVSFWTWAQQKRKDEPYGLEGYLADIDLACGIVMHSVSVAYGPLPIDSEDEESFVSRWVGLTAKAAVGNLTRPSGMPVRDFG